MKKLYKCRCMIIDEEKREEEKHEGQIGSPEYYCFGCDAYFEPLKPFGYFMYYLGKPFGNDHWGHKEMLTWFKVQWWLVGIKIKIEELFERK